ncbi:MAG TPA: DUF2189 domain-containing protein [Magnetospirillum sp.]|jgi:uncharacterized membrane protein|nr:DUF2189 domain-containing protein [Magnetospirillum sp.]
MKSTTVSVGGVHEFSLRDVTLDHPWRWLSSGWLDMCCEPAISYAWGTMFTAIGLLLLGGLEYWDVGFMILPLAFGFALVGPAAAVGLYEVSRRLEDDQEIGWSHALGAFRRNSSQIALIGMFLLVVFLVWVRLAMLEFMLFFGSEPPSLSNLMDALFLSDVSAAFLVVGTLSGAVLAGFTFAMTAIAIPMLVDRPDCDAVTAMLCSLETVRLNPRPMALWAFLIAMFTLMGLALFFVGLVVTLPLIGHASWHAYRDLVKREC